ncbi:sulfurtransferase [Gordonia desulfuricans]|uniref:Sulfurtransferase n=1 Tax=Gordonia desulfuricans TaxID=89051 RepID=A0A7K3LW58_9ACTN|nr:rhodanese-like domain-containing protein [Gordonia desulfuricans]NDK92520.1 sulfurtransferase [Gordonia desulfuricans]
MSAPTALVDVAWLAENTASVVILDASIRRGDGEEEPAFSSGRTDFEADHIQGARFADLFTEFSDPDDPLPFMRPSARQVADTLARHGITDGTEVVVYDRLNGAWAARLWWVLRSFGIGARVLDGGLTAWTSAGLPTESGPSRPVSPVTAPAVQDHSDLVAHLDEVAAATGLLVCGLRREEFDGDPADPLSGHIPGSVSLPYAQTLDAAGRHDAAGTRKLAAEAGIGVGGPAPILYCGGAVNAAGVALALHEIGITDVRIYDGSLSEWRSNPERPLAQTVS